MLTLEFMFGMFIGSLVISSIASIIKQSSEDGVVGGVVGCIAVILVAALIVLCGFIGTWII